MNQSVIHNKYFTYAEHKPAFFVVSKNEDASLKFWIMFGNNREEVLRDMKAVGIEIEFIMSMIDMYNTALKKIDLHEIKKSIIDR